MAIMAAKIVRMADLRPDEIIEFDNIETVCGFLQKEIVTSPLKLKDIASRAGLMRQTVSRIAYGECTQPRARTLVLLCFALDLTLFVRRNADDGDGLRIAA